MVLVARTGALHKGHAVGPAAVCGPRDAPACGTTGRSKALHLHVGNAVFHVARAKVAQAGDVIGLPAGGNDYSTHAQFNFAGGFAHIQKLVARHTGFVGLGKSLRIQGVPAGKGERHGLVQSLAL